MVEVFKTDVKDLDLATLLIDQIKKTFVDYSANFDLQDCDNILRVESNTELIQSSALIAFLKALGCCAEILPDEPAL
ncbi:hypothetical protein WG906_08190 [Pedobacter sp. P351]|uniref:hypothetical protein n=1 Tax=Pedobacter superstes TaxID=3133441 RepID=UPI0030AEF161